MTDKDFEFLEDSSYYLVDADKRFIKVNVDKEKVIEVAKIIGCAVAWAEVTCTGYAMLHTPTGKKTTQGVLEWPPDSDE